MTTLSSRSILYKFLTLDPSRLNRWSMQKACNDSRGNTVVISPTETVLQLNRISSCTLYSVQGVPENSLEIKLGRVKLKEPPSFHVYVFG